MKYMCLLYMILTLYFWRPTGRLPGFSPTDFGTVLPNTELILLLKPSQLLESKMIQIINKTQFYNT